MRYFLIIFLLATFIGPIWLVLSHRVNFTENWQTASRDSANLAPNPETYAPAVVQVYTARTYHWRGIFATHTWIATKARAARQYTVYQVIGWRLYMGLPALVVADDIPDRLWFGHQPILLKDLRAQDAEKVIPQIIAAVQSYPYPNDYHYWPGPNSNTFPAYVARKVPDLNLTMPPIALGKDYLGGKTFWAKAPSGTGWQFSILGICGILLARDEGLEINLLGLVYGINFKKKALILPGIGWNSF